MPEMQYCPLSHKPMSLAFSETVLGKYSVNYYYCQDSGLLKTEKPYWLDEAYSDAIADTDTGLVKRNLSNSQWIETIIETMFNGEGLFLDVAGGYGLLTRLMRDKGFNFYTTDKYCQNLFAKAFEPFKGFKADALFAFEVLEHIERPIEFIEELFRTYDCRTLVFSTLTFSDDNIPSKDWWYYAFETGQHISFYQPRSLEMIAKKLGCQYLMIDSGLHIITDLQFSRLSRQTLLNKYLRKIYKYYIRKKRQRMSKTWDDYLMMKNSLKQHH